MQLGFSHANLLPLEYESLIGSYFRSLLYSRIRLKLANHTPFILSVLIYVKVNYNFNGGILIFWIYSSGTHSSSFFPFCSLYTKRTFGQIFLAYRPRDLWHKWPTDEYQVHPHVHSVKLHPLNPILNPSNSLPPPFKLPSSFGSPN